MSAGPMFTLQPQSSPRALSVVVSGAESRGRQNGGEDIFCSSAFFLRSIFETTGFLCPIKQAMTLQTRTFLTRQTFLDLRAHWWGSPCGAILRYATDRHCLCLCPSICLSSAISIIHLFYRLLHFLPLFFLPSVRMLCLVGGQPYVTELAPKILPEFQVAGWLLASE